MATPAAQYEKITPSEAKLIEFLATRSILICAACGIALPLSVYALSLPFHRQIVALVPLQYAILASLLFAGMIFRYVLIGIKNPGTKNIAAWILGSATSLTCLTFMRDQEQTYRTETCGAISIMLILALVAVTAKSRPQP